VRDHPSILSAVTRSDVRALDVPAAGRSCIRLKRDPARSVCRLPRSLAEFGIQAVAASQPIRRTYVIQKTPASSTTRGIFKGEVERGKRCCLHDGSTARGLPR